MSCVGTLGLRTKELLQAEYEVRNLPRMQDGGGGLPRSLREGSGVRLSLDSDSPRKARMLQHPGLPAELVYRETGRPRPPLALEQTHSFA